MGRPTANEYGTFYAGYISLVPEENIRELLSDSKKELEDQLTAIPSELASFRYAPQKWTVSQLLQHIIDTERIFSYRALCIARGEMQALPGFNEEDYARLADGESRSLDDMKQEFIHLRQSIVDLFNSLDEVALRRVGTASGLQVSVRALAYMIIGHARHHFRILRERYL